MKSIDFKERNAQIGFHADGTPQEEFNGIFAHKKLSKEFPGAVEYTMPFQLNEEEMKQVQETGCIWLRRIMPAYDGFQPIGYDVIKPEEFELPNIETIDEITGSEEKLGAEDFAPETFDIKELDLSKVNYFYKKQAVKHIEVTPKAQTEEAYDEALTEAKNLALSSTSNPGF
jgi:hypothetical protein